MCLAEFASLYVTRGGQREETSDAIPEDRSDEEEEDPMPDSPPRKIDLQNGLGFMYKKNRCSVIRFHKVNQDKQPEQYYWPWHEEEDIVVGLVIRVEREPLLLHLDGLGHRALPAHGKDAHLRVHMRKEL